MNKEINELVDAIKETDDYQLFKHDEAILKDPDLHDLLEDYAGKVNEYNELKKYNDYIDHSYLKNEIKVLKQKLSENDKIQQYYNSYYQLNDLLDEITAIVFKDIDESIVVNQWFK